MQRVHYKLKWFHSQMIPFKEAAVKAAGGNVDRMERQKEAGLMIHLQNAVALQYYQ